MSAKLDDLYAQHALVVAEAERNCKVIEELEAEIDRVKAFEALPKGELGITLQITRAATGITETHHLLGTVGV